MSILEILEAHEYEPSRLLGSIAGCSCGDWAVDLRLGQSKFEAHRAHVAEVLEQHKQEAKVAAYEDAERVLHSEALWQLDLSDRHREYRFKHCAERMLQMEQIMNDRVTQLRKVTRTE